MHAAFLRIMRKNVNALAQGRGRLQLAHALETVHRAFTLAITKDGQVGASGLPIGISNRATYNDLEYLPAAAIMV